MKYTGSEKKVTARPRSKRLRETGTSVTTSTTIVNNKSTSETNTVTDPNSHTHANKADLDKLGVDDGYVTITDKDITEDGGDIAGVTTKKAKAGYADEAGSISDDSTIWDKLKAMFLSKLDDDTAAGLITMLKGIQSKHYKDTAGNEDNLLGSGFELRVTDKGKSRLEVDELLVRMSAFFAKLEIRELSYLGGDYAFSGAGSTIMNVTKTTDGWKCHLMSNDGTTATENHWAVSDQARCETSDAQDGVTFNVKTKYYWRLVTATGREAIPGKLNDDGTADTTEYNYVTLSDTDHDGDGEPERGDKIVQMGNRNTASRQGLIYLRTQGTGAILIYNGVGGSYPYYSLGSPTLQLSPDGNIIYGKFYSTAYGETAVSIDDLLKSLSASVDEVKAQTDQKFDIWMYGHAPLPTKADNAESNLPATEWDTDDKKALHVQDLYYDTSEEPASGGGRAWRWTCADGVYYWELVTDQDTIAALEKIADVASDGVITGGAEKGRVYVDWTRAVDELRKYTEEAKDYISTETANGYDISTPYNAYLTAFEALGSLLNGGTAYSYDIDKAEFPAPAWIEDIAESTDVSDPAAYRTAWNNYYYTLSALLKEMSAAGKQRMDDMGSDSRLTPAEKLVILKEWNGIYAERYGGGTAAGLDTQAANARVDAAAYNAAFTAAATFLNEGVAWTRSDGKDTPSLIGGKLSETSDVDGAAWRSVWSAFYTGRTALLNAISGAKVGVYVSEPTTPYHVGDLWIPSDGNIQICIKERLSGDFSAGDWTDMGDMTVKNDPRVLLAALAEKLWKTEELLIKQSGAIHVYIGVGADTGKAGDVRYDTDGTVYISDGTSYRKTGNEGLTSALKGLYALIDGMSITMSYTAVGGTPPASNKVYDLCIRTVTFHDSFNNEDVEGNIEVLMWGGAAWELLTEGTTAEVQNLGDALRLIVFGADGTNSVDTSGLITKTTFNELFSQKVTYGDDGLITNISKSGLLTTAAFNELYTQKVSFDSDGNITNISKSGLLTTADTTKLFSSYLDENGYVKEAALGTYVKKNDDGTLESGVYAVADNIRLEGLVTVNNNFKVLADGTITAVNAEISGTLTATSGMIGGFRISGNGLTNINADGETYTNDAYIIFRNDTHGCFAGIGGNVLPASTGARAVARFENEDNSDWWGLGYNIAMTVSAKNAHPSDSGGNIAVGIYGGCITGMAVKTQVIGLATTTSSADLATLNSAILRSAGAVWASTQYYYKKTNTDGSVTTTTKTRDVYLTMPDTYDYDEGHMLKIKRGSNDGGTMRLLAGTSHWTEYDSGTSKWVAKTGKQYFNVTRDDECASTDIESEGDGMEFVYFPNLTCTIDSVACHGCWVQWKNPRDW